MTLFLSVRNPDFGWDKKEVVGEEEKGEGDEREGEDEEKEEEEVCENDEGCGNGEIILCPYIIFTPFE